MVDAYEIAAKKQSKSSHSKLGFPTYSLKAVLISCLRIHFEVSDKVKDGIAVRVMHIFI